MTDTTKEERLLKAIFSAEDVGETEDDDNFPDTIIEKVGYAEYVLVNDLQYIGSSINRLSRLHRLLVIAEKDGESKLPDIITNNELRMALEPLMRVNGGITEITEMLLEVYRDTKQGEEDSSKKAAR